MKFLPVRRVRVAVAAIAIAAVCGGLGGYLLGRMHSIQAATAKLYLDATEIQGQVDSLVDESRDLLKTLNASQFPSCSDAQIEGFRVLLYHAVNLRDAGRMHDGRLECSAMFGRANLPQQEFTPSLVREDGIHVYRNLPLYASGDRPVFLLQQGDSFVVQDPSFHVQWDGYKKKSDVNMMEVTMFDIASQRRLRAVGIPSIHPDTITGHDSFGAVGDLLFATHCSRRNSMCTSRYQPLSEAVAGDAGLLALHGCLGALLAAFLTLSFIFTRQHSRNINQQLRRAIRKDRLAVVYQPIVDIHTGRIVEAEALARWTDEDGYTVSPDLFVRIAEQRGFVGELTALIVRHVMCDFGATLRLNPEFLLNINVTASDLVDPRFLHMLGRSLAEAGVGAHALAIEVTESSTATGQAARDTIHELRRRGHSVQIDDFGTGYSSLAYLKHLSIDVIKIDKTFTQAVGTDAVTVDILPQILSMAEVLGLQVIVEGIETQPQAAYFAALNRPIRGQGWLFGRPVPAEKFLELLAEDERQAETLAESV